MVGMIIYSSSYLASFLKYLDLIDMQSEITMVYIICFSSQLLRPTHDCPKYQLLQNKSFSDPKFVAVNQKYKVLYYTVNCVQL